MNNDDLEWAHKPFSAGEKALVVMGVISLLLALLVSVL